MISRLPILLLLSALAWPAVAQEASPSPTPPAAAAPTAPAAAAAPAPAPPSAPPTLPPSLMFDAELARTAESIRQGLVAKGASDSELKALLPTLTLGAVVRYSEADWTIWVNGQRFRPGEQGANFEITRVTDDFVEFSMANGAKRVRLLPNQSFRADLGDVIEGPVSQ